MAVCCNKLAGGAHRVLEIGGTGKELSQFLDGKEFHTLTSPTGDICRRTPYPPAYFDLIVSKMGLEHFYDPFAAAEEITRLLAPGGTLLIITVWAWRYHTAPGVEDYFRFSVPALRQLFLRLVEVESGYDLADRRVDCRMDDVAVDDLGGWREHWYVYFIAQKPVLPGTVAPPARYRANLSLLGYSLEQVKATYETLLNDERMAGVINAVLSVKHEALDPRLLDDGERGLPSEERFLSTGYYRMMIGRYLFAGSQFCRDLNVLDSCSGLGWGSFLVSQYADRVTAFDIDGEAVSFAERTWSSSIRWLRGDALSQDLLASEFFDAVLAMEAVEHFTAERAALYVARMAQRLKTGGVFIGTSAFPATRAEAIAIAAQNRHHPHIFTQGEFLALLRQHYSRAVIIGGWMFVAIR